MRVEIPKLVKIGRPIRIEKLSVGYQVWNDYRFISFLVARSPAIAAAPSLATSFQSQMPLEDPAR